MQLGRAEIEILQALVRDETVAVSSPQRLRLEMMGLATDGPKGFVLTAAGREAARTAAPTQHEKFEMPERQVDAAGRKRMLERVIPGG